MAREKRAKTHATGTTCAGGHEHSASATTAGLASASTLSAASAKLFPQGRLPTGRLRTGHVPAHRANGVSKRAQVDMSIARNYGGLRNGAQRAQVDMSIARNYGVLRNGANRTQVDMSIARNYGGFGLGLHTSSLCTAAPSPSHETY